MVPDGSCTFRHVEPFEPLRPISNFPSTHVSWPIMMANLWYSLLSMFFLVGIWWSIYGNRFSSTLNLLTEVSQNGDQLPQIIHVIGPWLSIETTLVTTGDPPWPSEPPAMCGEPSRSRRLRPVVGIDFHRYQGAVLSKTMQGLVMVSTQYAVYPIYTYIYIHI